MNNVSVTVSRRKEDVIEEVDHPQSSTDRRKKAEEYRCKLCLCIVNGSSLLATICNKINY